MQVIIDLFRGVMYPLTFQKSIGTAVITWNTVWRVQAAQKELPSLNMVEMQLPAHGGVVIRVQWSQGLSDVGMASLQSLLCAVGVQFYERQGFKVSLEQKTEQECKQLAQSC